VSVIALFVLGQILRIVVITGEKREARLRARCPGDPRLTSVFRKVKTWMAGTSPAMTAG